METYWGQISSKYSKAFTELCKDNSTIEQWGEIDNPTVWGLFVNEPKWVLRHLFDFFDSRGIHIYCYTSNGIEWHYAILTKGRLLTPSKIKYESRESCELNCYEKAFELLELELN